MNSQSTFNNNNDNILYGALTRPYSYKCASQTSCNYLRDHQKSTMNIVALGMTELDNITCKNRTVTTTVCATNPQNLIATHASNNYNSESEYYISTSKVIHKDKNNNNMIIIIIR